MAYDVAQDNAVLLRSRASLSSPVSATISCESLVGAKESEMADSSKNAIPRHEQGALMDMTTLLIFVTPVFLLAGGDWVHCRWHAWKLAPRPRPIRFTHYRRQ